ncbi:WXG100 family type VII secretion target [Allokutzneria albata]|uniref:Proteins of 100 residues with WXG n=1 Tax=Allokutzneria albata TaxID=211114 RepID=A0A1G9WAZ0_ALLAB|nr:WXG100 family type VII secretion target [Allokutzneria albata]SDM81477.1 hypothetical protein SAMN04489726_3489 [Allokutzneria albata]
MADANNPPTGFDIEENGAYYGAGTGAGGSRSDYDTWDWKQIKAAVTGSAAVPTKYNGKDVDPTSSHQRASGVSDPQSLYNAANDFFQAREVLNMVGTSVKQQTEALAGEDGIWQGEAATAFKGLMDALSKAFLNHVEQLDGGPAGLKNVPTQLHQAGTDLQWARNEIDRIDVHYAGEAKRIADAYKDAGNGTIEYNMPNGLTYVSWNQQIVQMMGDDMRVVLKTLASRYDAVRFETEVQPVPMPNPLGPGGQGPPGPNAPGPKEGPPGGPKGGGPEVDPNRFAPKGGPEGSQGGGGGPKDVDPKQFDPSKSGGTGSVPPPVPFPGSGKGPGPSDQKKNQTPPPPAPPKPFEPKLPPPPVPLPGAQPPPSPKTGGGGSGGGLPSPKKFGGGSGGGAGGGLPDLHRPDLKDIAPAPPPKLPSLDDWAAGKGLGGGGSDQRNLATPPPMMPPMSGAGGGGGAGMGGGSERSDASGLLGGEVKPWEGKELPGLGDPQGGTDLPSEKPQDWAATAGAGGAQAPQMPMVPPMAGSPGAGAAAGNNAERSDASGLLGGEEKPWESEEIAGVGDPHGVDAPALDAEEWAVTEAQVSAMAGPPEERVAVVCPADEDEDVSAWDVAATSGLLWLSGAATRAPGEREREFTPDYALRQTSPWEHPAGARPLPGTPSRAADAADYQLRPFDTAGQPLCGEQAPEGWTSESTVEEEVEEEEKERTSADLLKQNENAWATPAPKAPGVIE